MRRTLILIISISILSISLFSQAKKKTQSTSKPEIDRLYDKYKSMDVITLYTPHGNLEGSISVETNDDEKPASVCIEGKSYNEQAFSAHLTNTIRMKLQQGYKPIKNYTNVYTYSELIEMEMKPYSDHNRHFEMAFSKGQMSFLVGVGKHIILRNTGSLLSPNEEIVDGFYWYITTTDTKRASGSGGSVFEF